MIYIYTYMYIYICIYIYIYVHIYIYMGQPASIIGMHISVGGVTQDSTAKIWGVTSIV